MTWVWWDGLRYERFSTATHFNQIVISIKRGRRVASVTPQRPAQPDDSRIVGGQTWGSTDASASSW